MNAETSTAAPLSTDVELKQEVKQAEQELEQAERGLERFTEAARTRYQNALEAWERACRRADLLARKMQRTPSH